MVVAPLDVDENVAEATRHHDWFWLHVVFAWLLSIHRMGRHAGTQQYRPWGVRPCYPPLAVIMEWTLVAETQCPVRGHFLEFKQLLSHISSFLLSAKIRIISETAKEKAGFFVRPST